MSEHTNGPPSHPALDLVGRAVHTPQPRARDLEPELLARDQKRQIAGVELEGAVIAVPARLRSILAAAVGYRKPLV